MLRAAVAAPCLSRRIRRVMGCSSSKADLRTDPGDGAGSGVSQQEIDQMTVQGPDKVRTFRERRLSMSQQQDANQRPRRLSIYGSTGDEAAQPSIVTSPCPTCSCKTMGGFEPVPGGSIAKINQDRGLAIFPWQADPKVGLFGVYDGHGRLGEKVSEFVIQNLPGALKMNLGDAPIGEKDPGNALSEAYIRVDTDLRDHVDATVSGTTAVTCLMKEGHMWIANSGDSRAIVCRKVPGKPGALHAIDLTIDHKPDSPGEMKRILQMGGHVTPAGANGSPSRVWHNLRGLAMARSIGDHAAATIGVIAEPEITECAPLPVPPFRVPRHAARHGLSHRPTLFPSVGLPGACIFSACRVDVPASHLTPPAHISPHARPPPCRYDLVEEDYAIVIASDGVWELLSSQTVADIIAGVKSGDVQDMCDIIVDQSSYMWKVEEGDYRDDITVIVLLLPWITEEMKVAVAANAAASASSAQ